MILAYGKISIVHCRLFDTLEYFNYMMDISTFVCLQIASYNNKFYFVIFVVSQYPLPVYTNIRTSKIHYKKN